MQEKAMHGGKMIANQQVEMTFCNEGDKWCAIPGQESQNAESWYKRVTQKSEEGVRRLKFQKILVDEAVHVRVDGEERIREVCQKPTDSIDDGNGVPISEVGMTTSGVSQPERVECSVK